MNEQADPYIWFRKKLAICKKSPSKKHCNQNISVSTENIDEGKEVLDEINVNKEPAEGSLCADTGVTEKWRSRSRIDQNLNRTEKFVDIPPELDRLGEIWLQYIKDQTNQNVENVSGLK